MLQPKLVKYRKSFTNAPKNNRAVTDKIIFGSIALMALENSLIPATQLEAARKAIVNYVKRKGKIWMRVFPDRPHTRHPAETRMGSGKGAIDGYDAVVRKGRILFELGGLDEKDAREAFRRASNKLSVKNKVVVK
ncbi:MAG: 50S ribosomal protein L16 [Candidatus Dojkabacteria bacterium]|nr:MAG: 50S ribosomal protein L16 [Candidatus Dojkabacteria bacterium]